MIFGCQSSILHTSVNIYIDTQARISMQGHFTMDVRRTWISTNGYPCFMDIRLQLSIRAFIYIHVDIHWFLWISMWITIDFYGYPCGYVLISMDIHGLAMDSRSSGWHHKQRKIFCRECGIANASVLWVVFLDDFCFTVAKLSIIKPEKNLK